MMTAQELQQELLQLLNEEFKQLTEKLKEESKSSELRINKAFDRMLGNLRKKPEDSANKEIKPLDSDWATDLVRSQEAAIEAIENPPEEKPTKGANEDCRVNSNSKIEPPPKPNTNPNPNLPIQTHSSLAVNKNTAAYVYSKIPRPWPDNTHIHTLYKSHTTEFLSQILQQTQRGKTHRFHLLNVLNFDGQLRTSLVASQAWIRAQPVPPTSDLFLLLYDFQNLKVGMSSSSPSRATNKANTVRLHSVDDFFVAFKQLYTVHCNSWTAAARPMSFPGVDRLRSRPDRPLLDSPVTIQALNRFQNRVFAVAQIRVTVIAILRHLPEFDPGDHRLKRGEERLDFDFDGVFAIFERVWDHECQEERDYGLLKMIDEIWGSILAISKKKKFGFIVCDFWAFEDWEEKEVLGCEFGRDVANFGGESMPDQSGKKKIWEPLVKLRSIGEKGNRVFKWFPHPISKTAAFCTLEFGLMGSPFGELGQKHNWALSASIQFFSSQRLGRPDHLFNKLVRNSVGPCQDWAGFKIINSFSFGDLRYQNIWATITIDCPFQVP